MACTTASGLCDAGRYPVTGDGRSLPGIRVEPFRHKHTKQAGFMSIGVHLTQFKSVVVYHLYKISQMLKYKSFDFFNALFL